MAGAMESWQSCWRVHQCDEPRAFGAVASFVCFALIGFMYYQNASFNFQREANIKLVVAMQTEVQKLLSQCIVPAPAQTDAEMMATGKLFQAVRKPITFGGRMTQQQVDGQIHDPRSLGVRSATTDLRLVAYGIATPASSKPASTMWPIAEYGKGKGIEYGTPDPQDQTNILRALVSCN